MTDYTLEDSVYILFTTRAFATGIPGTLSAATVAVYEDVTATPIETSIAVTESLNSIAGLNAVTIAALAASGYNAGGVYHVVIEAGTVDSVSVVGEVVGSFTIQHSAAAVDLANGTDGLGAIKADTAAILIDTDVIDDGTSGLVKIAADVAAVLVDTGTTIPAALVTIDDFLDTEVAAILVDTGTTIPALIATAQADLDIITDTDGIIIGAAAVDLIWDETLAGHVTADTAGLLLNEWQDGGRLDLILDIIAADTTTDIPALIATAQADLDLVTGADGAVIASGTQTFDMTGDITGNLSGSVGSVTAQVSADVVKISGSAAAADNLEASALTIVPFVVEGTPTTTEIQTDLAETTDDHYIGRYVLFITGDAKYQGTCIEDYTGATGTLTVTQITTAPSAGDTGVIV